MINARGQGYMDTITAANRGRARWRLSGAVVIVVAAIGIAAPGVAVGATGTTNHGTSAASDQYDKPAKEVAGTSGGNSSGGGSFTPPSATSSSGTLPFTGVSLIWPAVGAFALLGLGVAVRRHERKS